MTRNEFKSAWESENADVTMNVIAYCYVAWGLGTAPRTSPLYEVVYAVLKAAGAADAEDWNPELDIDE